MTENKKNLDKKEIAYWLAALLLFGLFLGLFFANTRGQERDGNVRVVMLGDSIFGQVRDETSVAAVLSELLEQPVFNGALGGTAMGRQDEEMRLSDSKDSLSMEALARAIARKDFGIQQTTRIRESGTEHFASTIDELATIDFEQVELLLIGHGINDYHRGMPIYNEKDAYDSYTFSGALRSALETLRKKYPEMRIVVVTPTYSWYVYYEKKDITCEVNDLGGGILEEYVNAQIQVAESIGVEVIDLYHDFYPHDEWSDWERYTTDGVHPNEEGRKLIAQKIYEYLCANEQ